jgi:hypothetical protein
MQSDSRKEAQKAQKMNELFPIVRRKRRPLLVQDVPPMAVGNVEPPKVEATESDRTNATDGTHGKAGATDEKVSTRE